MIKKIPVVTIDGPSGVGKGTLSKLLAEELKWNYLDSGALYRALALSISIHKINLEDKKSISLLTAHLDVRFDQDKLFLEGEDVTKQIRTPECSTVASKIAKMSYVREGLISRQRAFRKNPGLIADGRDMGTAVFTDAELKIFITADAETRAKRRKQQLQDQGVTLDFIEVLEEIKSRDEADVNRKNSPLKQAEDAILIDNSNMTIKECFRLCISKINHITA